MISPQQPLNRQHTVRRQRFLSLIAPPARQLCSGWMHSLVFFPPSHCLLDRWSNRNLYEQCWKTFTEKHSLRQHYQTVRSKPKNGPCSLSPSSTSSSQNELDFLPDWKPFALQLAHMKKIIASFNTSNFSGIEAMAVQYLRECALV